MRQIANCFVATLLSTTFHIAHCDDTAKLNMRTPVVVGYLPHYRIKAWSSDQVGPVTDLICFGGKPSPGGGFDTNDITSVALTKLQKAKRTHGCRLLICVGGWERSEAFAQVAAAPAKRRRFILQLRSFCIKHQFDGVDFDWEHPKDAKEQKDYESLLADAVSSMHQDKLMVTVANASWQDLGKTVYETIDRVHLMSYDHDFPQSTLEKSRADISRIIRAGCPRQKVALGIPLYGRDKKRRAKSYADLMKHEGAVENLDVVDGYSFNGFATIEKKLRLMQELDLAGIMLWELGQDDYRSKRSILKKIEKVLQHEDSPSVRK